jgi:hypothetical protein
MNKNNKKINQIKYKSEILSLIEKKYEEISGLLLTYKAIKSENGRIITSLRTNQKFEAFSGNYANEVLIQETKTEEPILEINEEDIDLKEDKEWYLVSVLGFYNKRIIWYQKFIPKLRELNERLKREMSCN